MKKPDNITKEDIAFQEMLKKIYEAEDEFCEYYKKHEDINVRQAYRKGIDKGILISETRPLEKKPDYPLLRFFGYAHLPEHLQEVSRVFCDIALYIEKNLPHNEESLMAMRKLLEAKDCAVRARLMEEI